MIMSHYNGALARRTIGARALAACFATIFAIAALALVAPGDAQAAYAPDTWNGYSEFGYVGKAKAKPQRKSSFSRGIRKQVVRSERKARKTVSRKVKRQRYAALGTSATDAVAAAPKPSLGSGGGIRWAASSGCLNGSLRAVVAQVAANYGSVTVNSTCRNRGHNARVGGARKSHHLTGNAVDFRVRGNIRGAYAYLRSSGSVGGLKHYGGGLFHIDTGARRSW
jgi:hypothetical protein